MRWTRVGIAALIVLSSLTATWADEVMPRLVGLWSIKYDNGVRGLYNLKADKTASVWEPGRQVSESGRQAAGKIEVRDGDFLVVNDDGRLQRWTPVGRRAVVEHWQRAADYPDKPSVVGIAEPFRDRTEAFSPVTELPLDFRQGVMAMSAINGFVDAMRKPLDDVTAGELRQYIDPGYLKEHELEEGAFPIRRVVTGSIVGRALVDSQTIFLLVETDEAEKEIWHLRLKKAGTKSYILPPLPPDPTTKVFQPWAFRVKL